MSSSEKEKSFTIVFLRMWIHITAQVIPFHVLSIEFQPIHFLFSATSIFNGYGIVIVLYLL